MKPTVLDAHALLAYLRNEPGRDDVADLLAAAAESDTKLLMTTVNMGEVYYGVLRTRGSGGLRSLEDLLRELPIQVVVADMALAKAAAHFKATKKMSYADCFAAALAKLRDAEVVTGDPEFKKVEDEVKVRWLGQVARDARPPEGAGVS